MENEKIVPPSDDTEKPVIEEKIEQPVEYITKDEIPNLVGQIASFVKSHFQEQINELVSSLGVLTDKVTIYAAEIKDLQAELAKESAFTKDLHKTLFNHQHSLPKEVSKP